MTASARSVRRVSATDERGAPRNTSHDAFRDEALRRMLAASQPHPWIADRLATLDATTIAVDQDGARHLWSLVVAPVGYGVRTWRLGPNVSRQLDAWLECDAANDDAVLPLFADRAEANQVFEVREGARRFFALDDADLERAASEWFTRLDPRMPTA